MRLLVLCAWAFGVGVILLVGLLLIAQEIFSESIFGVPHEPGAETGRGYTDEGTRTRNDPRPLRRLQSGDRSQSE
jgi:hypothetical protein